MNFTPSSSDATAEWPRTANRKLVLLGFLLAALSFVSVVLMRNLTWHSQRDLELRETFLAFRETGTLLIKAAGTGSYNVQAPAAGPWVSAAWDDDPGGYVLGSLMGLVTGSDSPYPGLTLLVAFLVAVPMLWLPTAVARLFRSHLSGYAVALLPIAMWLTNGGSILAGTQYGKSDFAAETPVYALYGLAASLVFLSLSALLWIATYRYRWVFLTLISALFVLLATMGNLIRSLSGVGVILGIGVLWWLNTAGRRRFIAAILATIVAFGLSLGLQNSVMLGLNSARADITNQNISDLPNSHGTWHPLYLGLAWPEPISGESSNFDVKWDDLFGWEQARKINPDVIIGSGEYDLILRSYYIDAVLQDPLGAVGLYVEKFFFIIWQFSGMIVLIISGLLVAVFQRPQRKTAFTLATIITAPTILLGLVPPVLVMPMLYYFSELTAALSLLVAVSLGAFAWSLAVNVSRQADGD